jgi:hypothetical protein
LKLVYNREFAFNCGEVRKPKKIMKHNVALIVAFTENGFWAYAPTLPEALKKLQKLGGRGNLSLSLVGGDPEPTVDQYGGISYGGEGKEDAYLVRIGPVGTVASVRRKLKGLGYSL